MYTIMAQYMDRMDKQLQLTRQAIREETSEENKQLRAQVQKLQGQDRSGDEDIERRVQKEMWKIQDLVEAQLADSKTKASQNNMLNKVEYHDMTSQLSSKDMYSDDQIPMIMQACTAGIQQLLLNGVCVQREKVMEYIDVAQLERVEKAMGKVPTKVLKETPVK